MNKRQLAFVRAYQGGASGRDAAVLAGYSLARAKQTAHELLRRPDIAAALSKGSAELVERSGVDVDWFLEQFLGYHERGLRGEVPAQVGLKGLEDAAKLAGLMVDRKQVESVEVRVVTLDFGRELLDVDD